MRLKTTCVCEFFARDKELRKRSPATLLKDAAPAAPDASKRKDEVGTMNDE
jgi:hypothetical protein